MSTRRDSTGSYIVGLGVLTLTILVVLSVTTPNFLTVANLNSMGSQFPEFGLLALAVLPTMISGGIDLSVVAIANLASIIAALLLRAGPEYAWLAIPAALLVGLACGVLNGCLIAYLRLPPILATLGTMQLFSGIGIVITRGPAITGVPAWYGAWGNWSIGGMVPMPLVIFTVVALALGILLRFTASGMRARLFGANPTAARFAGIGETGLIIRIYAVAGVIASIAGLVILARVNSANADYGGSYLLLVILINILAGVSPFGGFGSTIGVVLAVITLQLISSGLNFLAFSAFARDLFFGGLLIIVMSVRALMEGGMGWLRPRFGKAST
ncbi:MAG: ABC transporter permease [Aurantimonas endophytica]|uniref:Simple sugar transport system permease protein n=1 Tax=Aurantimonas endophytica TaxID=1522175 RepID=A0A7W6HBG6_9HYPH|nr:ABC transporter permease [Aurantimonas endophytica]MBB4002032.1 simple sugar transport system permease protein [Aurantimonas endophytica]MCO6402335.1 ABC transporter permease [Aurantimonas endophytica]